MIAHTDISSSFKPDHTAVACQEALYDAGLVRRVNAGDDAAFAEIVIRYREQMFAVALGVLRNRDDADEIAQDTFIRAYRGLPRFRGDASLSTWLYRIALNLARNRYWYFFRRRRHTTVSLDEPSGSGHPVPFSDLVAANDVNPVRAVMAREFSELVTACTARLSAQHRGILALRNSPDCAYEEIARELGISVGTVKSRLSRARERLLALLAEACPEFGPDAPPTAWFDFTRPAGRIEVNCA